MRINKIETLNDLDNLLTNMFLGPVNHQTKRDNHVPLNITDKNDDIIVQLSVPGFSKENIEVKIENKKLVIEGKIEEIKETTEKNIETPIETPIEKEERVLRRDFKVSSFKNEIILNEEMVVNSAELKNGILTISIKRIIPENLKPRNISISE